MKKKNQQLTNELRELDPVRPGTLDGAVEDPAAEALLQRIVATDPDAGADRGVTPTRPLLRRPAFVLAPLAAAAAAVVLLVVVLSGGGGGGGGGGKVSVAGVLDQASAAAANQLEDTAELPYAYLKTSEMSVQPADADGRSWWVYQPATREEWIAEDGSGRLRVVSGPARFVDDDSRGEWEAAGRPNFLPLGFEQHTEDRWLSSGTFGRDVEELPAEPTALAHRLAYEAEGTPGGLPVAAATLQLIAEDLRDPGASPALRAALYQAARRVPGVEYLGARTDTAGRHGVAIGVTDASGGEPVLYSLIFDPENSDVLASETTALEAEDGAPELQRSMVYVESRGIETMSGAGETWLSAFGSPAPWGQSPAPYLIYRVAGNS
jgi:hypothetical protein